MSMAWKGPYRPNNEVTQNFNSGKVTIYTVTDAAQPGYQPKPTLKEKITLRYENRRLGIQRYYEAMQNQIEVERVIRVPKADINNQDVAETEDGKQYRIDLVQNVEDAWPSSLDLTLTQYIQEGAAH